MRSRLLLLLPQVFNSLVFFTCTLTSISEGLVFLLGSLFGGMDMKADDANISASASSFGFMNAVQPESESSDHVQPQAESSFDFMKQSGNASILDTNANNVDEIVTSGESSFSFMGTTSSSTAPVAPQGNPSSDIMDLLSMTQPQVLPPQEIKLKTTASSLKGVVSHCCL
jgi:hypothetical protein